MSKKSVAISELFTRSEGWRAGLSKLTGGLSDEIPRADLPVTMRICGYTEGAPACALSNTSELTFTDLPNADADPNDGIRDQNIFFRIEGRLNPGACISNDPVNNRLFLVVTDPAEQYIYGATSFDVRSVTGSCP